MKFPSGSSKTATIPRSLADRREEESAALECARSSCTALACVKLSSGRSLISARPCAVFAHTARTEPILLLTCSLSFKSEEIAQMSSIKGPSIPPEAMLQITDFEKLNVGSSYSSGFSSLGAIHSV